MNYEASLTLLEADTRQRLGRVKLEFPGFTGDLSVVA